MQYVIINRKNAEESIEALENMGFNTNLISNLLDLDLYNYINEFAFYLNSNKTISMWDRVEDAKGEKFFIVKKPKIEIGNVDLIVDGVSVSIKKDRVEIEDSITLSVYDLKEIISVMGILNNGVPKNV